MENLCQNWHLGLTLRLQCNGLENKPIFCLFICLFIPVNLLGDKFSLKYILVNTYNTRHLDRKKAPRGVYNVPQGG